MKVGRVMGPFVAFATVVYGVKLLFAGTPLYEHLHAGRGIDAFGSLGKIASPVAGAWFAARCARIFERGNPARMAWAFFAVWLGGFGAGQLGLTAYEYLLHETPPLPSLGDGFFLLGYVFMLAGLVAFIRAYRAAGFAIDGARRLALVGAVGAVLAGALAVPILLPIATTPQPSGALFINLAYPLLDLVTLVPTLVLLWITRAFRGGTIWSIWATTLVAIVFMSVGDILFGYTSSLGVKGLDALLDLAFFAGYFLAACGARLQLELLTE